MRYANCQDWLSIYALNPDKVCIAYLLKSEHELLCSDVSLLVWLGKEQIYLDKVYANGFLWRDAKCRILQSVAAKFDKPAKYLHSSLAGLDFPKAGKVTFTLRRDCDTMPGWIVYRYASTMTTTPLRFRLVAMAYRVRTRTARISSKKNTNTDVVLVVVEWMQTILLIVTTTAIIGAKIVSERTSHSANILGNPTRTKILPMVHSIGGEYGK